MIGGALVTGTDTSSGSTLLACVSACSAHTPCRCQEECRARFWAWLGRCGAGGMMCGYSGPATARPLMLG